MKFYVYMVSENFTPFSIQVNSYLLKMLRKIFLPLTRVGRGKRFTLNQSIIPNKAYAQKVQSPYTGNVMSRETM